MEREIRRFTDRGLDDVTNRLLDITAGITTDVTDLLEDESLSTLLEPAISVEIRSRRDAAEFLTTTLSSLAWDELENDAGIWTWLALVWIDTLAPVENGRRTLGEINRWVLASDNWARYYRHLLAGPCYIYTAHKDEPARADAVLCSSVANPGEVAEQVAARLDLVRSPGIMGAITSLYFDEEKQKLKKGAASKGQGSARRLGPVLMQFDRTWDVQDLASSDVLSLLPPEFDKFKPPTDS
jgi:hypothetical protein